MHFRSPAEFYIKYLVVHPDNYSVEAIGKILDELNLDFISVKYVTALKERTPRPTPFFPKNNSHVNSQRFLLRQGLREIFRPGTDMKSALRILESPRAKEFVESMLLSHAPMLAIADSVTRHRGLPCTEKAIELYRHYFWNVDLLDATQMRSLLYYRQENIGSDGEAATREEKLMHRAAKKAGYLDPRRLAADLPYSPTTALMAQMRMGTMPGKMELAGLLQMAQAFAVVRTTEATMYGSDMDSHRAANFAIVAKTMTDILEKVVKPDENLTDDLRKIALRTDARPMPTIHQLSGGEHTVELQPTRGTHDDGSLVAGGGNEDDDGGEESPGGDVGLPGGV